MTELSEGERSNLEVGQARLEARVEAIEGRLGRMDYLQIALLLLMLGSFVRGFF